MNRFVIMFQFGCGDGVGVDQVYVVMNYVLQLWQFIKVGFVQCLVQFGDVWIFVQFVMFFLFFVGDGIVCNQVLQVLFGIGNYCVEFQVVEFLFVLVYVFVIENYVFILYFNEKCYDKNDWQEYYVNGESIGYVQCVFVCYVVLVVV